MLRRDKDADKKKSTVKATLLPTEPGDYYLNEEGFMVFTAQYHLRRGYCCGNKCKHCPFGYENVDPENK